MGKADAKEVEGTRSMEQGKDINTPFEPWELVSTLEKAMKNVRAVQNSD